MPVASRRGDAPGRLRGPAATARALPASWPVVASCARAQPHTACREAAARQRRHARCGPHGAGGACLRDARAAAGWPAPRSVAAVAGGTPRCRRRPSGGAHTAPSRDRHGAGTVARRATQAPARQAAGALHPTAPLSDSDARSTRDPTRPAQPCSPHPGRNGRGRRARARDPRPGARPRPGTARGARSRSNRRGPADHRLVTSRPAPSEACFARLAGVAPIPASSGQTTRHRLSRGGDRQLNRALHTIVLHRRQHDPATRDYIAKRVAEGKSRRDATRLLKRYLARHLYRLLEQQPQMT